MSTRVGSVSPEGSSLLPLGAVLAGGGSRRFGEPKALARVGGVPMVERARRALEPYASSVVALTSDPSVGAAAGLPILADRPGSRRRGPLAGIEAALGRAEEKGLPGVVILACDLPLVPSAVVGLLVRRFLESPGRVVVPESPGPLGVEPLCACYPAACVAAVGEGVGRSVIEVVRELGPLRVTLAEIDEVADSRTIFLNVNTPDELDRAERLVSPSGEGPGPSRRHPPEAR
jgi:molybdenum cofactor guanylyltransferase